MMADTSHEYRDHPKFPPVVTATFIVFIVAVGLAAVLTSPRDNYSAYEPSQQFIVAATDLPAPLKHDGQIWIPVASTKEQAVDPANVRITGVTIESMAQGVPADDAEAAKTVMFLRDRNGVWQRYVTLAALEGSEAEAAASGPDGMIPLPATFRFRGYTWRPGGQAIFRSSVEPLVPLGRVLGRVIYTDEPGPEAHRNSIYVEVRPGSDSLEPYVPEEALYSTSGQKSGNSPGLGGQANPFPVTDSPTLPFQPVQDPKDPDAVLNTDTAGAVTR